MTDPAFTSWPDLAARDLGGSVMFASDELFAEKENLIKPQPAAFAAAEFGHKGKVYDGWETRRRRAPGHDYAIVRLGAPGIVHGVVVDTAHFRGNFPARVSVEAVGAEGYPGPDELAGMDWQTLVPPTEPLGDSANHFAVADRHRWTHVRLSIYPDGGVARFRVHGQVLPDPRFLTGTIDLAAMENGGELVSCSDAFYSSAGNLIRPGRPRSMADGWENARRRRPGHDYAIFALGAPGLVRSVEIDTSCFVGNAPGWVRLLAADERAAATAAAGPAGPVPAGPVPAGPVPADPGPAGRVPAGLAADRGTGPDAGDDSGWEVLPKTAVQPDTRHRFLIEGTRAASHIRLDVYPDGGLARLRVYGELEPLALAAAWRRWRDSLPSGPDRAE
jgi:allantoicase